MRTPNKRLMWLAGISAILYLINRFIIIGMVEDPTFFSSYVGDFFALPVYLPLSVWLAHRLRLIDEAFELSVWHLFLAVLLFSVIFEGILPIIDTTATRDPGDIIAYLDGGILVYVVNSWKRPKEETKEVLSEGS